MEDYAVVRKLAEGRFGTVFEAVKSSTSERVAAKKVRARRPMAELGWDPWSKSAEREIEVLARVAHQHVVRMLEHFVTGGGATMLMIYEYVRWDLATVLERSVPLDEGKVKAILQMILLGLAYLHAHMVMHRDLKPPNMLLDGDSGCLKIADFGSARFWPVPSAEVAEGSEHLGSSALAPGDGAPALDADGPPAPALNAELTREVCTRWYKCPEMLFGAMDYTQAVDMWAVGCTLAELLSPEGAPFLPGNGDLEQLCLIFQACGTPNEDDWPEVRELPDYNKVSFSQRSAQPLAIEGQRSPQAVDLVRRLTRLNPAHRLSASDAMSEEFFQVAPPAVEPKLLVSGLPEEDPHASPDDENPSPLMSAYGSDDSGFACGPEEFEPIAIETTSCGLWDTAVLQEEDYGEGDSPAQSLSLEAASMTPDDDPWQDRGRAVAVDAESAPAPARHRTPSPPRAGQFRFKAR